MLQELLEKQRGYTEHFFSSVDLLPIEELVQRLVDCQGVIFLSGVGKSGLVAKKIAFTMVSTGTRAFFLSPTDAVHGDIGMVSANDVFIIFSKSGESDELINLIPAIRNKGATVIGVVCNSSSRLASACDMLVTLPFKHELCPFDMAPTMSTTIQLLFGDLLTVALMRKKNFSLNEYALNHPSGQIGKRITLLVRDLMLSGERLPLCKPDDPLGLALVELSNKRCGCILVADDQQKLLGIFTDGDLRRSLQRFGSELLSMRMEELMTVDPQVTRPDILAWEAMKQMEAHPNRRLMMLPVVGAGGRLFGLIHIHDIIQSGI